MIKPGKHVKDISIKKGDAIDTIFDQMAKSGGFESKNLVDGLNILTAMIQDKNCLKFMSFVGAIVSTGLRGVITDMVKNKMCDVIITTCGALDHDIARHYSNYLEGSFTMDDSESMEKEIHRLGNVLVPMKSYGPLIEEKMQNYLLQAYKDGKKEMSTRDITKMIGEQLGEDSFLYWANKNNIPVIVPGIMDGAVGSQIWMFSQNHSDFKLNILSDADLLSGLIFKAKKSGALMIGGGISKHHTLWWNQYREGLDYAVYITTAQEFDGRLEWCTCQRGNIMGKSNKECKTDYDTCRGNYNSAVHIFCTTCQNQIVKIFLL